MPTYVYKREDGSTFEVMQGINDEPLEECPTTGQPVKRVISGGAGVVYKGDGWYVTDYKNNGRSNGNGSASKNKSSNTGTSSTAEKKDSSSSNE
jgi:putative FmdB family regulatory protein